MIKPNPYDPSPSVGNERGRNAVEPSDRSLRDAWLLSALAFATAPITWVIIWYFTIYLPDTDPSNGGLTRFEKFDELYGLLPLTLVISVVVSPLVFAVVSMKGRSKG